MELSAKKIKFTITKVETIEIEVSTENGFDMPESAKQLIEMDSDIKNNPMAYVDNINGWELESTSISEIEYE